ncbi:VOC family protein [Aquibium sp. ELW1220]|uniref:VOC family protein n=1 Tax=Aquibium sp. ELW1220 TaxID=2976766 RepID=UPI0025AFB9D0|nr:VOC family protein [Aquibium sp. ELW1220]MDN2580944.1 VOC family protein [Aquibium sp. ELW1220]
MPKVFELGFVALAVADFARTRDYYVDTFGTTEVDREKDGTVYLSLGYHHHDIVLRPADGKSLLHLGYQLTPGIGLDAFAKDVRALGLKAERKTDSQPGIAELVEVEGPAGNVFQFYETIDAPAPGFKSGTVSPLSLGHVAVISPEAGKLIAFYRDFLGFWETDWIGDLANFLTCSYEHHVVNIVNAPLSKVHHIAFQLQDNSHQFRAADRLIADGVPTKWGPSRHTAGHNVAAYHYDPDKNLIELYTDMDVFVPGLGMCQPRPWHEHYPMKPRRWDPQFSAWEVEFGFDLAQG